MRSLRFAALVLSLLPLLAAPASAEALNVLLTSFEEGPTPRLTGDALHPDTRILPARDKAHLGRQSARLQCRFVVRPGRQYAAWTLNLPLSGQVQAIKAWIYGDGSRQPLRLRLRDASGECHQFVGGTVDWTGWREVSFPLTKAEVHWDGDNNGRLDLPLRIESILVDSAVKPYQGNLYLDDISYVTRGDPLDFVRVTLGSDRPGNVFWGNEPVRFRVQVQNLLADRPQNCALSLAVGAGEATGSAWTRHLSLPAGGGSVLEYCPRVSGYGLRRVQVSVRGPARTREETLSFARLRDGGKAALDPSSPFGACTHFAQGKGILPATLELLARMGGRWLRDEASWSAIEREKGRYTFPPAWDAYIRTAPRYGIEPYLIFDYGNPLYDGGGAPSSREGISAFSDYAYQMVRRYKDSCHFWEVYNEPNGGFWKPQPDPKEYALVLRAASLAAKRADPNCTVIGMCTAGTDLRFIEEVLKQNVMDAVDGISIHPYRYPRAPEESDFLGELTRCKELVDRYGGKEKTLWLTEIGWPTQNDAHGVSEEVSANYLVRMYVQAMSLPFVRTTFWYDFQNDGTNPAYNEHNFGLIRTDFTPKAGYVAYRMMAQALGEKRFTRRLPLPEPVYAYEFVSGRERAIAAWCARGAAGALLHLNVPSAEVSDARGNCERRATTDGILSLALSETPVFLTGRFASPEVTAPALQAAAPVPETPNLGIQEAVPLLPGESGKLAVTVRNPWKRSLAPSVRVEAPQGWSVVAGAPCEPLPPGGEGKLTFTVKVPPTAECRDYALRLELLDGTGGARAFGCATVSVANPFEVSLWPIVSGERDGILWQVHNRLPRNLPPCEVSLTLPDGAKTPEQRRNSPFNAVGGTYELALRLGAVPPTPDATWDATCTIRCSTGAVFVSRHPVNFWHARPLDGLRIDGKADDWASVRPVALSRFHEARPGARPGPDSQPAAVRLATTPEALCLLVEAKDEKHFEPFGGARIWEGDSVQLAVSEAGKTEYLELGLSLGPKGPEVYGWRPATGPLPQVRLAAAREGDRTTYEAAIPWSLVGVKPQPGTRLGFSLLVNENDGLGREGWLELFSGIGFTKDPNLFGSVLVE